MRVALGLSVLSAGNLLLAFAVQWFVVIALGAGAATDALFASMSSSQLLLAILSGSIVHVLVPILSAEPLDRQRHTFWAFFAVIGAPFLAVTFTLYVLAPWWVPAVFPGFQGHGLVVELTQINLIGACFAAASVLQSTTYHATQKYLRVECAALLANAIAVAGVIWAVPRFGVIAAAWVGVMRYGLQSLLLLPGIGLPAKFRLGDVPLTEAWRRLRPLVIGTAYYKTDIVFDRFLLSMATAGNLSLYYLAHQIYAGGVQIIGRTFGVPLVPQLTRLHTAGDKALFQALFRKRLLEVALITIAVVICLRLFGNNFMGLLTDVGELSRTDIGTLWILLLLMSGQFVIGGVGIIVTSVFYSTGDTSSPTWAGIVSYSIGIGVKLTLFFAFGTPGLAVAVSVYYFVSLLLLSKKLLEKKLVPL
jgi:putative peptidoglycan lipid II flippase